MNYGNLIVSVPLCSILNSSISKYLLADSYTSLNQKEEGWSVSVTLFMGTASLEHLGLITGKLLNILHEELLNIELSALGSFFSLQTFHTIEGWLSRTVNVKLLI